jgi:small subunit ribosomal protein S20
MAKLKTGRHTSGIKEVRKSVKRHWANAAAKNKAKELAKQLLAAVANKDAAKAKGLLPQTMSAWTRMGTRHVVHPATASRKIARLSKAVSRLLSSAH